MGVYRSGTLPQHGDHADHIPAMPEWRCQADGERWPCEPGRRRLAQNARRPEDLVQLMNASAEIAIRDLGATTPEAKAAIRRHMVDWVPR